MSIQRCYGVFRRAQALLLTDQVLKEVHIFGQDGQLLCIVTELNGLALGWDLDLRVPNLGQQVPVSARSQTLKSYLVFLSFRIFRGTSSSRQTRLYFGYLLGLSFREIILGEVLHVLFTRTDRFLSHLGNLSRRLCDESRRRRPIVNVLFVFLLYDIKILFNILAWLAIVILLLHLLRLLLSQCSFSRSSCGRHP